MIVKTFSIASNIFYILIGIAAYVTYGFTPFVVACVILGIGSGLYHTFHDNSDFRLGYWSHHADELGIYIVFFTLFSASIGMESWWIILVWASLHFAAEKFNTHQVLSVLGGLIIGSLFAQQLYFPTIVAILMFGSAYYVRSRGNIDSYYHGLWHVWTSILILFLYDIIMGLSLTLSDVGDLTKLS